MASELDFLAALRCIECLVGSPYDSEIRSQLGELTLGNQRLLPSRLGMDPAGAVDVDVWLDWLDLVPKPLADAAATAVLLGVAVRAEESPARDFIRALSSKSGLAGDLCELACRAQSVRAHLDAIVGDSPAIGEVRARAWSAAFGASLEQTLSLRDIVRDTSVLILGETGTGKELVARALKDSMPGTWTTEKKSDWTACQYDAVNLASLPDTLVSDALFGHDKGAFSGAEKEKKGILERCAHGVVFLDEVAELPPDSQVALLRVLQEGKVRRLGGDKEIEAAPRVISATHRDIRGMVVRGEFREDLYYRLAGVVIEVPPLRDRPGDIELIAQAELEKVASGIRTSLVGAFQSFLEEEANDYRWPGNVRELTSVVHSLALGLPPKLSGACPSPTASSNLPDEIVGGHWTMAQLKSWYAQHVRDLSPNHNQAAQRLGVDRSTLVRQLGNASS